LPPTRLRVAALLAAGMSVREIAEEIGVAKSAVQRMKPKLERWPAPRLPPGRRPSRRRQPAPHGAPAS